MIITKNGKKCISRRNRVPVGSGSFVQESFVFEDEKATGNDTVIAASIKVDDTEIAEILGDEYTDDQIKELIWREVDRINAAALPYRQIKRVISERKISSTTLRRSSSDLLKRTRLRSRGDNHAF